jgi:hypothetical protein
MLVHLTCPNGHWAAVEDPQRGQTVRCPVCQVVFAVPEAGIRTSTPAPAVPLRPREVLQPDPQELDWVEEVPQGPQKRKMKTRQRMARTKLGLGFHYAKFLCTIAGIALSVLALAFTVITRGGALGLAVGCLSWLTHAVTPLLGLVGSLLCFWVPRKAQARVLVQVSFGLDAGSILVAFVGILTGFAGEREASAVFFVLSILGALAASILFMLFLRALAFYLDDEVSGNVALQILIHWILALAVPPCLLFLLVLVAIQTRILFLGQLFVYGGLVVWLVVYVKVLLNLLNLIATIRQTIAARYNVD